MGERLTAAAALAETNAAREADRLAAEEKRQQNRLAEERHLKWIEETVVPETLTKIDEEIRKHIRDRGFNFILSQTNSSGRHLAKLVMPDLQGRGYMVRMLEQHISEYRGSADDGYAYAHGPYTQISLSINW